MLSHLPEEVQEKKRKENEDAMNRVILMVVLNALVNFICKIPLSFISINDLKLLIANKLENLPIGMDWKRETFSYSIGTFCDMNDICMMFANYAQFLYFFSLSVNIFFFYSFDLKFKLAFRQLMSKREVKSNQKSSFSEWKSSLLIITVLFVWFSFFAIKNKIKT